MIGKGSTGKRGIHFIVVGYGNRWLAAGICWRKWLWGHPIGYLCIGPLRFDWSRVS